MLVLLLLQPPVVAVPAALAAVSHATQGVVQVAASKQQPVLPSWLLQR
jgi:hypothetical protein